MRTTALDPFHSRTIAKLVIVGLAIGLIAAPAAAEVYIVTLNNGNTFLSKYKPREATYDTSKLLIMTEVGNIVALDKSLVSEIKSDLENRGLGLLIDTSTIMIGYTANDAPIPGEEGELGEGDFPPGGFPGQGGGFPGFSQPAPMNTPLVAEPNSGGGIPVSFVTGGLMPTSAPAGAIPP